MTSRRQRDRQPSREEERALFSRQSWRGGGELSMGQLDPVMSARHWDDLPRREADRDDGRSGDDDRGYDRGPRADSHWLSRQDRERQPLFRHDELHGGRGGPDLRGWDRGDVDLRDRYARDDDDGVRRGRRTWSVGQPRELGSRDTQRMATTRRDVGVQRGETRHTGYSGGIQSSRAGARHTGYSRGDIGGPRDLHPGDDRDDDRDRELLERGRYESWRDRGRDHRGS